jgi:phage head maturation protease
LWVSEKRRGNLVAPSSSDVAVGTGSGSDGGTLRGYAIAFNTPSVDLGGFTEVIRRSAVDRTIAEKTDLRSL